MCEPTNLHLLGQPDTLLAKALVEWRIFALPEVLAPMAAFFGAGCTPGSHPTIGLIILEGGVRVV
jgi:hypothetical protein